MFELKVHQIDSFASRFKKTPFDCYSIWIWWNCSFDWVRCTSLSVQLDLARIFWPTKFHWFTRFHLESYLLLYKSSCISNTLYRIIFIRRWHLNPKLSYEKGMQTTYFLLPFMWILSPKVKKFQFFENRLTETGDVWPNL